MDEPSNSMDQTSENNLINNLKDKLDNKTVILLTQKMSIITITDRVIVMHHSKVLMDGSTNKIIKR